MQGGQRQGRTIDMPARPIWRSPWLACSCLVVVALFLTRAAPAPGEGPGRPCLAGNSRGTCLVAGDGAVMAGNVALVPAVLLQSVSPYPRPGSSPGRLVFVALLLLDAAGPLAGGVSARPARARGHLPPLLTPVRRRALLQVFRN